MTRTVKTGGNAVAASVCGTCAILACPDVHALGTLVMWVAQYRGQSGTQTNRSNCRCSRTKVHGPALICAADPMVLMRAATTFPD